MRVLVACEYSGVVREAFRRRGHDAMSADLLPSEIPGPHRIGDVREVLSDGWDLMVAFPPCDHLSGAGSRWWTAKRADGRQQAAEAFFMSLMNAPIPRVAVENPQGRMNTAYRRPDQTIHPYHFGDPYLKRTCLWLAGLPKLAATNIVPPLSKWVGGDSAGGLHRDPKERARTFPGVAEAMAEQWGARRGLR